MCVCLLAEAVCLLAGDVCLLVDTVCLLAEAVCLLARGCVSIGRGLYVYPMCAVLPLGVQGGEASPCLSLGSAALPPLPRPVVRQRVQLVKGPASLKT